MPNYLRFLGRTLPILADDSGKTLLDLAIDARLPHLHECGGNGMCTTCRVRILDGGENLSEPTEQELYFRDQRGWKNDIRLACQAHVLSGDVLAERLISNTAEISNLQLEKVPVGIGEETNLVVLFCDMRNFTSLSERQTNFDMAHILNRFFTAMGDAVIMNNGIIYQYAGDEIVALFGVGGSKTFTTDAVRAAICMTYAVERLNSWDLVHFDASIDIGVGLHYGRVFIGNIGHPQHKQFAVIGDTINVTSRIQNMNRSLDTRVLISQDLLDELPGNSIKTGTSALVELKGKSSAHTVYEVKGFTYFDAAIEIQSTIDQLLEGETDFASAFYRILFDRAPELREMFAGEMSQQSMLLTHMLRGIVFALCRPEQLLHGLRNLGEKHRMYGVKPEHYLLVRDVLHDVVASQLGDQFTKNRQKAWFETIDLILDRMQK